MSNDELDRYMFSLEGYLRKVDSLRHLPRRTLCNSLLPNFGHIGSIFLANYTCPQALRGLQIIIKLIFYAKESNTVEEADCPSLHDFINQLQDHIISGKISPLSDFETQKLTYLLPKYRNTQVLTLIKDCLKNPVSVNIDDCIQRSSLVEDCGKLNLLFFPIILTFCDILSQTNGHWFIGKIIGSFKRIVISRVNGNVIKLFPSHLHPFLPHLELLDQQLSPQATSSSLIPNQAADKLCRNLDKSQSLGICKWYEIVALLILYPVVADFLVTNRREWIEKLRN
ncbi:uncharacterized protein LOC107366630 [Tetranychus urticae]|uniref:uncharacterized protein LOC107366630 n=1 Tax=Tetranychus urticae TaxID=32264 RepID=UPI00077BEB5E|nr:uncharacterized protein LOC107366630 [Tetranychus urticae]